MDMVGQTAIHCPHLIQVFVLSFLSAIFVSALGMTLFGQTPPQALHVSALIVMVSAIRCAFRLF